MRLYDGTPARHARPRPSTPDGRKMDFIHESTPGTPEHDLEHRWMLDALCRGRSPADFFPSDGAGVEAARRLCEGCPVREPCLEYALEHRIDHGVWGGASERERRRILRSRRLAATVRSR